jgi:sec-independent protein translocase protein TatA
LPFDIFDPVVIVLILVLVIFLFGANKIPGLAKAFGQARREFDVASKGGSTATTSGTTLAPDDPLIQAAQREGIDTQGKTKEQIASELSFKLNKK